MSRRIGTMPALKAYLCLWQADVLAHRKVNHTDYRSATRLTGHKTLQTPNNFASVNIDDEFVRWYYENYFINSSDKTAQRPAEYIAANRIIQVEGGNDNLPSNAIVVQSRPTQLTLPLSSESEPIDWRSVTIASAQQIFANADNVNSDAAAAQAVVAAQRLTKALQQILTQEMNKTTYS